MFQYSNIQVLKKHFAKLNVVSLNIEVEDLYVTLCVFFFYQSQFPDWLTDWLLKHELFFFSFSKLVFLLHFEISNFRY